MMSEDFVSVATQQLAWTFSYFGAQHGGMHTLEERLKQGGCVYMFMFGVCCVFYLHNFVWMFWSGCFTALIILPSGDKLLILKDFWFKWVIVQLKQHITMKVKHVSRRIPEVRRNHNLENRTVKMRHFLNVQFVEGASVWCGVKQFLQIQSQHESLLSSCMNQSETKLWPICGPQAI